MPDDIIQQKAELIHNELKDLVKNSVEESLTFMSFPTQHWFRIRTNNTLERLNREIKRRTKVVGTFPVGNCFPGLGSDRVRAIKASMHETEFAQNYCRQLTIRSVIIITPMRPR